MNEPVAVSRAAASSYERLLKRHFQLIAENARDLIVLIDAAGRRIYVSPSYRDVYGPGSMLGGSVSTTASLTTVPQPGPLGSSSSPFSIR